MTGEVHEFEPREGGAFSLSQHYTRADGHPPGKSGEGVDRFRGRFAALVPGERIAWAVEFESADPAFAGEMTITTTLAPAGRGTPVTMTCEDIPPGIRPEDNDAGTRAWLEQLAAWLDG